MKLKINGEERQFEGDFPETLSELLDKLDVEASTVVAEVEGRIVERKDFEKARLEDGQQIELIRFVPGG
jgi:thiamine biosynthesis protein ThiS